jgi:3-phenylpropionate/trans-cinnamate dioxygenase ferredoxin reductase subunit
MTGMVIVGAGEAGTRAAMALREAGWVGPIALVGEEAEAPYERPPLSKAALTCEPEPVPKTICDQAKLADAGVDFVHGVAATGIDRAAHRVVLADGRRIPYGRLLLATGARVRRLAISGSEHLLYLRSFADALALRRRLQPGTRVGIIGGGFIGLELAASAVARGCVVTVVELAPRILGRAVPEAIAAIVAARHEAAGVRLICGTGVERVEDADGSLRIMLSTDGTVACDVAIAGVGAAPDTALAEAAGLDLENGIRVDATLRTSDPDIFAAGDCCSFPHPLFGGRRIRLEAWRNAQDQGNHVARTMLGSDVEYDTPPWFWSDQHDLTLQIAGLPDAGVAEVVRRREDGVKLRFRLDDAGRLVAASAVGIGNAVAKDIRLTEMLIARRAVPDRAQLADPSVNLKRLLPA